MEEEYDPEDEIDYELEEIVPDAIPGGRITLSIKNPLAIVNLAPN